MHSDLLRELVKGLTPIVADRIIEPTAAEAQAVVKSLDQAVHAVQQWIANFNVKKIRTDVMKLD